MMVVGLISQEWQKRASLGYVRLERAASGVGTQACVWAHDPIALDQAHTFANLNGKKVRHFLLHYGFLDTGMVP
jgi:hypothetical protein